MSGDLPNILAQRLMVGHFGILRSHVFLLSIRLWACFAAPIELTL
jgi:hypothetical protein